MNILLSSYVYLNFDPVDDWRLRESSRQYSDDDILGVIHAHIKKLSSGIKVRSPQRTVRSTLTDTPDPALDFGHLESP